MRNSFVVATLFFALILSQNVVGQSAGVESISATDKLAALIKDERAFHYQENPGTGPRSAPKPRARSLKRVTPADQNRRMAMFAGFKERLDQIVAERLDDAGRLNQAMLAFKLEGDLLFLEHRTWRLPLYSDSGFHTAPTRLWRDINFQNGEDYDAYIEQLSDIPRYLQEHIANLKLGIAEGFTMPQIVLEGLMPTFRAQVAVSPEASSFYTPFVEMAPVLLAEASITLRNKARRVIAEQIIPAYSQLARFMEQEYMPAARGSVGANHLPNGTGYYAAMVRYYTTLDVSADEVHALGLREVARIRREMEQVIKATGFTGSFSDFLVYLRTDPQFYAKDEKQLLMTASYLAKQIDGRLPQLFGKLPRQPYGVEAVPAEIAPNYTTGRYLQAAKGAPRGGYYWVNTYALDTRPLYVLPSLTLHEAMPGHHLQIALAAELENVPDFRLDIYPHAFGEGWGLYAEKLGLEIGVYETPYQQFGRLTYEMWRACRLVIDTGIHAKSWSRAQAIKLLEDNSALSKHNIRVEVDRYIAWPGQALAYKMGELKILELRVRATKALGATFDVRKFHDRVLSAGGIPLFLLEDRVEDWIAEQLDLAKTPH